MLAVGSDEGRIVAVLHDVVEDSSWTIDRLRAEGFDESILTAINALTRRDGEDYFVFIQRAAANSLARRVKIADLRDNLDLTRITHPSEQDHERLRRYREALLLLGAPSR